MTAALPTVGPGLVPFALVAAFMVAGNLYFLSRLFPRRGGPPTFATAILVIGLLVMSMGLWFALIYAILSPGDASTVSVFIAGNSMMAVFGTWAIGLLFRSEENRIPARGWVWPSVVALLFLGNEILMGAAFVLAQSGAAPYSSLGYAGLVRLVADAVDSVWFFWGMLANMMLLVFWLPLGRAERVALVGLSASAAVGPWVVRAPLAGALAMAAIMTVVFVLLFEQMGRSSTVSVRYLRTAAAVAGAFGAMALGELLFLLNPDPVLGAFPFAAVSLLVMAGEVLVLAHWTLGGGASGSSETVPLFRRPRETATFLGLGFVTEWMMAASILLAVSGSVAFPVSRVDLSSVGSMASSGFGTAIGTVAAVTASPVFLGLMGIEMGALVVTRMRRATERAQRVRLGMALGTYGVYTVLGPALVGAWAFLPGAWPNVGALGPVTVVYVPVIAGSYGLFLALAFLFGRRSYCSVMCPSAVMYGGSFSQRLIPSLRESALARHQVLGSRWKRIALAVAVSSWAFLIVVVGLSLWNTTFGGNVRLGGFDPAVVYAAAIWNVVWYGFFISIPYVGMSPCRSWGFCSTGTLLGVVGYFGLYHKQALDPEVCRSCPTRDCGKACEVGLVDMPAVLAREGRYRAIKCVGAHDCEVACPYGNLVSRDVRDAVRRVFGLPDRYAGRVVRRPDALIPMVSTARSSADVPGRLATETA